ncbi:MAG: sigma-54 dependent transcriptional regulator [Acidobacteriia bacterium]|nr:sigma-54 dependent transcriptional regulator [Terriglobia bacterium]
MRRLLLIEDEPAAPADGVQSYLTRERGFDCKREIWNLVAPPDLNRLSVELVIFVAAQASARPMSFFSWLREQRLKTPTLAVLPLAWDPRMVRSAAELVDDFVLSPVRAEELEYRAVRIMKAPTDEILLAGQKLRQELGLSQLVGNDPAFVAAIGAIPNVAASSAPVLLLGETGTGKELCAHAIHSLSERHAGPFIPVECGAIPENLVESELFGHVRGAFTDAHCEQKGLAAMADGGTLFLDEVDSLPLAAQAKLLRFIQEGIYRPLGAQTFYRANLRLVSATNRDLEHCVRQGQFRSDLYFRLNVLPLRLPPLRERRSDIPLLVQHFLGRISSSTPATKLTLAALRVLDAYDWPGNVRELHNVVQRGVAFCSGAPILPAHLGLPVVSCEEDAARNDFRLARSLAIEKFEKAYVEEVLRKNGGNVTRAAQAACKDRRVFGRLVKRYGIDRRNFA